MMTNAPKSPLTLLRDALQKMTDVAESFAVTLNVSGMDDTIESCRSVLAMTADASDPAPTQAHKASQGAEVASLIALCEREIAAKQKDQTTYEWLGNATPKRILAALATRPAPVVATPATHLYTTFDEWAKTLPEPVQRNFKDGAPSYTEMAWNASRAAAPAAPTAGKFSMTPALRKAVTEWGCATNGCEDADDNLLEVLNAMATAAPIEEGAASAWPCGGCGEATPLKRCIGCLHNFYQGKPAPIAAEQAKPEPVEPGAMPPAWDLWWDARCLYQAIVNYEAPDVLVPINRGSAMVRALGRSIDATVSLGRSAGAVDADKGGE